MLDFMRKQSHNFKWVWIVLIFIFSVTLVTFYIPLGDLGSIRLSDDVATVGSESVTAREFQSSYQSYINRVGTQLSPEILKVYRFDLDILNSLIMQRVVATEAKRLGLGVSDAEVEQYIVNMQAFHDKDNNFIGVALYQQYLQSQYPPISVEEFEKSIRDQILQEKLRTLVTASIAVTDKEAEEEYRKRNEKAVLDYLVIDPTRLESQATASEQDIKDYYEKNKATYNIPERRQAKYVYLSAAKLGAMENPTDQEMLDYYNQHQSDYRTAETVTAQHILFKLDPNASPAQVEAIQEKARGVLERARMGEDFAALARQFSDDTTAARGGNLGPIQRGQMVPEFEKAVFDLNTGGVSDLVKTQFGYHIIKVNDKQNDRIKSFDEVKDLFVRPALQQERGNRAASDKAQLAAVEAIKTKDISAVADKVGGEVRETPMIERNQSIPGIGPAGDFQNQLFSLKEKGDFGPAVSVVGGYAVIMLADKQDPHPAALDEVKERVVNDVKVQKARELAVEKGNQVQEEIKAGKDLRTVARAVGVDVRTSEPLARGGSIAEFGQLIDSEKEIFSSLPIGKAGTPLTSAGKTFAFAVKERHPIDPAEMKKSLSALRAELLDRKREEYFAAYTMDVRKRMEDAREITIDQKALEANTKLTS